MFSIAKLAGPLGDDDGHRRFSNASTAINASAAREADLGRVRDDGGGDRGDRRGDSRSVPEYSNADEVDAISRRFLTKTTEEEKVVSVDLRSDTVTLPSREMRAAMAAAAVGDSVYGEDPTTAKLERKIAEICGKESGLLVPSGRQYMHVHFTFLLPFIIH